jgi:hypothetical protein
LFTAKQTKFTHDGLLFASATGDVSRAAIWRRCGHAPRPSIARRFAAPSGMNAAKRDHDFRLRAKNDG